MRAIKIDSENRVVSEIELDKSDSLKSMQEIVGGYICQAMEFDKRDTLFVNDDGLLDNPQHFFWFEGLHQPLAGNGVITGCNANGNTVAVKMKIEQVLSTIRWLTLAEIQAFIRSGRVNYNTYLTVEGKEPELLSTVDLGAFDSKK